jgi:DNA-binding transcriptional ArsR family regulator
MRTGSRPSRLAQAVGVTPYKASRHLAALQQAGVVHRRPRGNYALYRLADPTVMPLYELVARGLAEPTGGARAGVGGIATRRDGLVRPGGYG